MRPSNCRGCYRSGWPAPAVINDRERLRYENAAAEVGLIERLQQVEQKRRRKGRRGP